MSLSSASKLAILGLFTLWVSAARAGEDPSGDVGTKGKAAAHAALDQKADVPPTPPQLPDQASDRAQLVHLKTAFGAHGEAMRDARAHGQRKAGDDGRAARADEANQATDGAAASAARNANADSHAAAGQARAAAAKAKAHGK